MSGLFLHGASALGERYINRPRTDGIRLTKIIIISIIIILRLWLRRSTQPGWFGLSNPAGLIITPLFDKV